MAKLNKNSDYKICVQLNYIPPVRAHNFIKILSILYGTILMRANKILMTGTTLILASRNIW